MGEHAKRIAIITDSTCDIPPDLLERHRIIVVPQYLIWGTEELRDGYDIDNTTFFARLPNDPVHPKTSQPVAADFARVIEQCGADEVVVIVLSNQLSGTIDSVHGARELANIPVHPVDSLSVSMGLGWQVLAAAHVRDRGGNAKEIIAAAQHVRENLSVLLTVDTLDYLHKGGRIGGAAKLVGTALQLKPMLTVDTVTGRVEPVERTRTRKKALDRIVEATVERMDITKPIRASIVHGAAPDEAQALFEEIKAQLNPVEITLGEVSAIIGVHTGPGVIGVVAYNE